MATTQSLVALLSKPWVMMATPAAGAEAGAKAARKRNATNNNFFPDIADTLTENEVKVNQAGGAEMN